MCPAQYNGCKWRGHTLRVEPARPAFADRLVKEWADAEAAEAHAASEATARQAAAAEEAAAQVLFGTRPWNSL